MIKIQVEGVVARSYENGVLVGGVVGIDQADAIAVAKNLMRQAGLQGDPEVFGEDFTSEEKKQGILIA